MSQQNIIELLGRSVGQGFQKAAEKTVTIALEDGATSLALMLPTVLRPFLPAFVGELASLLVKALLNKGEDSKALREAVEVLKEAPFRTGVEQLGLALSTSPVTDVERIHRADRFREARANLDEASQLSNDDRRPVIDFYRGLASFHIPGGTEEAIQHWGSFQKACAARAALLNQRAEEKDKLSSDARRKGEAIPYERTGGGGGMAVLERNMTQARRTRLLSQSQEHELEAASLRDNRDHVALAGAQTALIIEAALLQLRASRLTRRRLTQPQARDD